MTLRLYQDVCGNQLGLPNGMQGLLKRRRRQISKTYVGQGRCGERQPSSKERGQELLEGQFLLLLLLLPWTVLMGGSAVSSGTDLSVDVYEPGHDVDLLETQIRLQQAVQTLITGIGEDLKRDGLRDTPKVISFPCE